MLTVRIALSVAQARRTVRSIFFGLKLLLFVYCIYIYIICCPCVVSVTLLDVSKPHFSLFLMTVQFSVLRQFSRSSTEISMSAVSNLVQSELFLKRPPLVQVKVVA